MLEKVLYCLIKTRNFRLNSIYVTRNVGCDESHDQVCDWLNKFNLVLDTVDQGHAKFNAVVFAFDINRFTPQRKVDAETNNF